jgi:hypothetical protein
LQGALVRCPPSMASIYNEMPPGVRMGEIFHNANGGPICFQSFCLFLPLLIKFVLLTSESPLVLFLRLTICCRVTCNDSDNASHDDVSPLVTGFGLSFKWPPNVTPPRRATLRDPPPSFKLAWAGLSPLAT